MDLNGYYTGLEFVKDLFTCEDLEQEQDDILSSSTAQLLTRSHNWSEQLRDILNLISDELTFIPQLQKFGACCKNWHLIAEEKLRNVNANAPLILLPYNETTKRFSFYNLRKSQIYDLNISDLQSHWIFGSSNGWLGIVNDNLDLSLFNPLTRSQIPLPRLDPATIRKYRKLVSDGYPRKPSYARSFYVSKLAIMEDHSSSPNFLVAIIFGKNNKLGLCRLGDKDWTVLSARVKPPPGYCEFYRCFEDIICHNGKIYALETLSVKVVDYLGPGNIETTPSIKIPNNEEGPDKRLLDKYIVMSSGHLLFVQRYCNNYPFNRPQRRLAFANEFHVYRLGKDGKTWTRVYCLEGESLFVGSNESISVLAKEFSWLKSDYIYFTDDSHTRYNSQGHGYQLDNGVFCLKENRVVERFNIQHSLSLWPTPAMWYHKKC